MFDLRDFVVVSLFVDAFVVVVYIGLLFVKCLLCR